MKTIITINFNNYSENNTVLSLDCLVALVERMKNDSDFVSFEIAQAGDDVEAVKEILFPKVTEQTFTVEVFNHDNEDKTFSIDVVIRKDGKVKLLADTFSGECRNCFQKVRETGKGYFVNLYGSRLYFTSSFNNIFNKIKYSL
jgi:hypothetical protein